MEEEDIAITDASTKEKEKEEEGPTGTPSAPVPTSRWPVKEVNTKELMYIILMAEKAVLFVVICILCCRMKTQGIKRSSSDDGQQQHDNKEIEAYDKDRTAVSSQEGRGREAEWHVSSCK